MLELLRCSTRRFFLPMKVWLCSARSWLPSRKISVASIGIESGSVVNWLLEHWMMFFVQELSW